MSSMNVPENRHIEIDHVSVVFGTGTKQVTALSDVTFHIQSNEFVSLLGPSGCGKSTLLRIIADLLQPTSGSVRIAGSEPEKARLQRQFGIVFQTPALFDWRTVRHNVELPLEILGTSKKNAVASAVSCLRWWGSPDLLTTILGSSVEACSSGYPLPVRSRWIRRCC